MPDEKTRVDNVFEVDVEVARLRQQQEIAHALQLGVLIKMAAHMLGTSEEEIFRDVKGSVKKYRLISDAQQRTTEVGE